MISTRTAGLLALAAALVAGPALAQTSAPQGAAAGAVGTPRSSGVNPGTSAGPAIGATTADAPSTRNPVLTDGSDVRASKVIGSSVYNDRDEKIGSIDDILLDRDHKVATAVVSVGGFLGLGSKLVEVPYNRLEFGDTRNNTENKVKLSGATKDSLQGLPDYHYHNG